MEAGERTLSWNRPVKIEEIFMGFVGINLADRKIGHGQFVGTSCFVLLTIVLHVDSL